MIGFNTENIEVMENIEETSALVQLLTPTEHLTVESRNAQLKITVELNPGLTTAVIGNSHHQ